MVREDGAVREGFVTLNPGKAWVRSFRCFDGDALVSRGDEVPLANNGAGCGVNGPSVTPAASTSLAGTVEHSIAPVLLVIGGVGLAPDLLVDLPVLGICLKAAVRHAVVDDQASVLGEILRCH